MGKSLPPAVRAVPSSRVWIRRSLLPIVLLVAVGAIVPLGTDRATAAAPACRITKVVRYRSHGDATRCVQEALRAVGAWIAVDGVFGPQTQAAVIRFQEERGIGVSRTVGPVTGRALGIWGTRRPPAGSCAQVNLVGDSLAKSMKPELRAKADHWDLRIRVKAKVGRPASRMPRAVSRLREQRGDTRCWVVVGGTNDLWGVWNADWRNTTGEECNSSPARRAEAQRRIDLVLDRINRHKNRLVWWVDVDHRGYPDTSCIWNRQLRANERIRVVNWYRASQRNDWLVDDVHSIAAGDHRRASLVIRGVR